MRLRLRSILILFFALFLGTVAWAGITGSISGLVTDPSGAVVVGAQVIATETQTGLRTESVTDAKGFYNFPTLAIGTYDLEVHQSGFKTFHQTNITIDANSAVKVDVALQVGTTSENVEVRSDAVQVETQTTQMGEVITGTRMTSVPLNGRAYTDLLSLQPGVVPSAYGSQSPGLNDRSPSGAPGASGGAGLNSGNQSVNGQREAANGFMVNGANVEEGKNNGTSIVPNLDSISEFRIITNNFDAEYGNFSGGQINVATKSGGNDIHGSAFEFFRNTDLDARNFFNPASTGPKGKFDQNQFGGTVGGPIKKDKLFFFLDYQGTRQTTGSTINVPVPSSADRTEMCWICSTPLPLPVAASERSAVIIGQVSCRTGCKRATLGSRLFQESRTGARDTCNPNESEQRNRMRVPDGSDSTKGLVPRQCDICCLIFPTAIPASAIIPPRRSTIPWMTIKVESGSTTIRVSVCSRPIISSTTTPKTTPIQMEALAYRASTPTLPAEHSSSNSAITRPLVPPA